MATHPTAAADVQATFSATLVDEWARCGVSDAVVAPGSRSTPLALALAADERIRVHLHIDERSAGFLALGIAAATWQPTVVLTTSGTAAVELHPAVVEADLGGVPLLVCTADRPPELRDVGAPQAIDQTHLYGRSTRWFHDPGVADAAGSHRWRALAARAYAEAITRFGPVHLNLPFREPLLGTVGELPPARPGVEGWTWRPPNQPPRDLVVDPAELAGRRGVVVAGAGSGDPDRVEAVAAALGWPVLTDARAPARRPSGVVVAHADPALRSGLAGESLRPEVVLRLGDLPASRVVGEWLAAAGGDEVVVAGEGRWLDPHGTASTVLELGAGALLATLVTSLEGVHPVDGGDWLARWRAVDGAVAAAIDEVLGGETGITEPGAARTLVDLLPDGARLVASSSMPIRDLEWYPPPRQGLVVHANRGANGIDGVVSTAVGMAAGSGAPTALLIGDLAFLHDVNGLLGAEARGIDLVVVVVDNDGGGIFSFLPQAEVVPNDRFELLFGTPHGLDLVAVAAAHGARARAVDDLDELRAAVTAGLDAGGVHVVVAHTDRRANLDLHRRLSATAAEAASAAVARWGSSIDRRGA